MKILDFGLAKLGARPKTEAVSSDDATRALHTQAGMVLGTIGYMAPEQVQSQPVDARADIFALGVVMWEMLSGERPFRGDSAIDTMHAILREDPPEIAPELGLPSAMERILRRCLEKDPDARFQNAQDLAFQLENLGAESSGPSKSTKILPAIEEGELPWYRTPHKLFYPFPVRLPHKLRVCFWDRVQLSAAYALLAALVVVALLAVSGVITLGRLGHSELNEKYEPAAELTGILQSAAISRDGKHAAFAVNDGSGPIRLLYREGTDIRATMEVEKPPATDVLAIADTGTALLKSAEGSIFQMEMRQNASAMEIATKVLEADIASDGTKVALLRSSKDGYIIEFPAGRTCYTTKQRIRDIKISPKGDALAFFEQEAKGFLFHLKCWRANGTVESWTDKGPLSMRGGYFEGLLRGVAWNANGDGLYLATQGNLVGLLKKNGQQVLHRNAGNVRIYGATNDGLLLEVGAEVTANRGLVKGQDKEADLSWIGGTLEAVSGDGSQLLVSREDEIWVLPSEKSKGKKVGIGKVEAFSSDGKMVLYSDSDRVYSVPSQGGDLRTLATADELKAQGLLLTVTDGLPVRFVISEDGKWALMYSGQTVVRKRLDGSGGLEPVKLTFSDLQPGWRIFALTSTDGNQLAMQVREGSEGNRLVALDSASGKEFGRVDADQTERLLGWSSDNGFLTFATVDGNGVFQRVDLKGTRRTLRTLEPPMANASGRFRTIRASSDGTYYAYRYSVTGISQLVLGKGL